MWFMVTCELFVRSQPIFSDNIDYYYISVWLGGSTMKIIYRRDLRPTDQAEDIRLDEMIMPGWMQPTQYTRMYQSKVRGC